VTASLRTDAPSHTDWLAIDWQQVETSVRQLQVRIVKATQAGKWRQVKNLQRLLTHSRAAKLLAVRRVTSNQGKNTPGIDKQLWLTPEQKVQAAHSLSKRGYAPQPLRRVYIPKANGQQRPLGIPTMTDRAMQALYLLALEPLAETTADNHSYGFRRERSAQDAISQCFTVLSTRNSARWIFEADIKGCFDNLSHDWLLNHSLMDKTILKKWLKAGYLLQGKHYATEEGTPQGGVISPVLMNLALDGLQALLRSRFHDDLTKRERNRKVNLIRYADDFVITGYSKEFLEQEVKPLVRDFLSQRGLELSEAKTRVTHIDEGFDFLGFTLRKYRGTLLITPSQKAVKRLLSKVSKLLHSYQAVTAYDLIGELNPVLIGWANYYKYVVSHRTFSTVDHKVNRKLWFWAKRRHHNKGAWWVLEKYFKPHRGTAQVFTGNKEEQLRQCAVLGYIPIHRHIKIRSEANPFDPAYEVYFEQRRDQRWLSQVTPRVLKTLYREQQGQCLVCHLKITTESGWNTHHLQPRVMGGKDILDNLVLLHPECHKQLHSLGFVLDKSGVIS
jgi:RNA-directed DNA polymerase